MNKSTCRIPEVEMLECLKVFDNVGASINGIYCLDDGFIEELSIRVSEKQWLYAEADWKTAKGDVLNVTIYSENDVADEIELVFMKKARKSYLSSLAAF